MSALLTWRLTVRFTQGGRFDKAPESILRNAATGTMLAAICPYAARAVADPPCRACVRQLDCVYPQVVKPAAAGAPGATAPPGYVLRYAGPHEPRAGDQAQVDLTAIGPARRALPELAAWIAEQLRVGVGPAGRRARAEVIERIALPPPQAPRGERLRIRFETPLVIRVRQRQQRRTLETIDGPAFARAIRQRVESMAIHDAPPVVPAVDSLRFESIALEPAQRRAYSQRQGTVLRADGLCGEGVLSGDLDAWRPALAWASRLGVGRLTAWGNGRISLEQA